MHKLRFIHTADLHLGRPFSGLKTLTSELKRLCCGAGYEAWDRIVQLACEQRVDFVTIGGDTFDNVYPTVRARVAFKLGIERLCDASIPAFMVLGNHDPLNGFPERLLSLEGLHIFGPAMESRAIGFLELTDGAVIYGASFDKSEVRENLVRTFRRDTGIGMAIGLLHANVNGLGGHKNYAPCTLDELIAAGMNAWCLGHVHAGGVLREDPLILYSGTSQGAYASECGPKGCYLITLDSRGECSHEFIPLAPVQWQLLDLDVADVTDEEGLVEAVVKACRDLAALNDRARAIVARIHLKGPRARSLTRFEDAEVRELVTDILADHSPPVFLESIRDLRSVNIELEALLQEDSFLGEFLRLCKASAASSSARDEILVQIHSELMGRVSPRYISAAIDPRRFKEDGDAFARCLDEVAGHIATLFV